MLTSDNCLQKIMVLLASGPCTPQEPLSPGKKATSELHTEVRIPEEPVARQLTADHARHDGAFQSGSGSDPIVDLGRWSVRLRPPVTGLLAHESPNKKMPVWMPILNDMPSGISMNLAFLHTAGRG